MNNYFRCVVDVGDRVDVVDDAWEPCELDLLVVAETPPASGPRRDTRAEQAVDAYSRDVERVKRGEEPQESHLYLPPTTGSRP